MKAMDFNANSPSNTIDPIANRVIADRDTFTIYEQCSGVYSLSSCKEVVSKRQVRINALGD